MGYVLIVGGLIVGIVLGMMLAALMLPVCKEPDQ